VAAEAIDVNSCNINISFYQSWINQQTHAKELKFGLPK